jgi:hypothetical protein
VEMWRPGGCWRKAEGCGGRERIGGRDRGSPPPGRHSSPRLRGPRRAVGGIWSSGFPTRQLSHLLRGRWPSSLPEGPRGELAYAPWAGREVDERMGGVAPSGLRRRGGE